MKTRYRPSCERLEAQVLMSGMPEGLTLTLTTDKTTYGPGEPIQMTLTETNTSDQTIQFSDGPSIDGFYVTQDGDKVWQSNAGPNPFFIALKTLQPGESFTLNATWDGHPRDPKDLSGDESPTAALGAFEVHSEVESSDDTVAITLSADSPPDPPSPSPTPTPSTTATPPPPDATTSPTETMTTTSAPTSVATEMNAANPRVASAARTFMHGGLAPHHKPHHAPHPAHKPFVARTTPKH